MPKEIKIGPNPLYKPQTPDQKAVWDKVKTEKPRMLDYVSAMENIRLSGNMYVPIVEEFETPAPGPRLLDDYTMDELKVMLVSLGIKTEKQMKKADVLDLIRRKLDEVEIVEDDAD